MKKNILFIILSFMMMPIFAKAASVSVSLSCPVTANENSEIKCNVNVTSDVLVNGLASHYILKDLTYIDFEAQNGFQVYSKSASGFAIGNLDGKSGTFTVGTITLKVTKSGSIQLSDLDASDVNKNSYGAGATSNAINIRLNSTNNSLKDLTLSTGTLSPSFSADITSYSVTVEEPSITINAIKGDSYQKVMGAGTHNLNYGDNVFNIAVTSESGNTKTYTIKITRPDKRSTNNYLKSLSLDSNNISLDKNAINYSAEVESNISSIKVNASLENGKASFVDGYGPRVVNLNYGNNAILIKVKAENESVRTYTINVNRKDNRSTNNYLKSLSLSDGKIVFDKDTFEYNISVNYDVTKIDVNALVEDEKAIVKVSNPELVVGDNTITIEVVSENGQVKNYKINVKRLSEEEKMSDNNKISKLNIVNHKLNFSSDVFEYKIKIGKNENELLFNVELEDEKASYIIKNNKDLKTGSIVSLFSISESGIEKEYKFIITKEKFGITFWIVIVSIISFIIGLIVGIFISKLIKKNNKNFIKKEENNIEESNEEVQVDMFEPIVENNGLEQKSEIIDMNPEQISEAQTGIFEPMVENNINNEETSSASNSLNFIIDQKNVNDDL